MPAMTAMRWGWRLLRRWSGPDAWALAFASLVVIAAYAPAWARGELFAEADTKLYYAPLLDYAAEAVQGGALPLWNPYLFMGYPQFADGETGVLFPLHFVLLWLGAVDSLLVWGPPLRALLAMAAAYGFARSLAVSPAGAALTGIAFGLGSFAVAQQHHLNVANSVFALPASLACWEMAFRTPRVRRRISWFVGAGIVMALAALGVHPQILVITAFGAVAYVVLSLAFGRWRAGSGAWWPVRSTMWALAGGLVVLGLGVGLAAIQLAPLYDLITQSDRSVPLSAAEASRFALLPYGLAQLLFPGILGIGTGYWSSWNHWETALYVGTVPLAFALLAFWGRRRVVAVLALLALLGWLVAQGEHGPAPVYEALRRLPGFDRARTPGRYTLITVLALATLAGIGLDAMRRRPRARIALALMGTAVAASAALAAVNVQLRTNASLRDAADRWIEALPESAALASAQPASELLIHATDPLLTANLLPALTVLAALACVVLAARGLMTPNLMAMAALGLAGAQLAYFGATFHPRAKVSSLMTPPHFLTAATPRGVFPRSLIDPAIVGGLNQLLRSRIADASGYASLPSSRLTKSLADWLRHPHRMARAMGVARAFRTGGPEFGFDKYVAKVSLVTYSIAHPALAVDAWSPPYEQTVLLPRTDGLPEVILIASMEGGTRLAQGSEVGRLDWLNGDDVMASKPLRAGEDLAERNAFGSMGSARPGHREANVAVVIGNRRESIYTLVTASPPPASSPTAFRIRVTQPGVRVAVHGISAIATDGRLHRFWSPPLRPVAGAPPVLVADYDPGLRVTLHSRVQFALDPDHALELMLRGDTEYPARPVLEAGPWAPGLDPVLLGPLENAPPVGSSEVEFESASELRIQTDTEVPSILIVRDAYDPGWKGFVDGRQVPVLPADLMSRGVPVPTGSHAVILRYDPPSVRLGAALSGAAGLALLVWVAYLAGWDRLRAALRGIRRRRR